MKVIDAKAKYAQMEVVAFWQRLSQQGLQKCEQEMISRYLPLRGDLLDVGCGAGRGVLALDQAGYRVSGIDLSLPMLAAGRRLSAEARLSGANLLALPFADEAFDAVLMFFGALQHIPGRTNRRRALAEMVRVVKSGGHLILGLDNLAPALICYFYWLKEKLLRRNGTSGEKETEAITTSSTTLWARQTNPLVWHTRGLARTLRWRTWPGVINLIRRLAPPLDGADPGDTKVAQFSLPATPHYTYYHVYRASELIEDATGLGLQLLGYHSGRELSEGVTYPPPIRGRDKQLFFAFRKKIIHQQEPPVQRTDKPEHNPQATYEVAEGQTIIIGSPPRA